MYERNILKLNAIRSKDKSDWVKFKKARNSVNSDIKLAKEDYFKNALNENEGDLRKTWRIVNELTSRKFTKPSIKEIKHNGISISNVH